MTNGGSGSNKLDSKASSFVRWQGIARDHLGTTINLVLTLATATLGFGVTLLFKRDMVPLTGPVHLVVTVALGVVALSIGLGIAVNISRLSDFRWTARSARLGALGRAYRAARAPRFPPWIYTVDGSDELRLAIANLETVTAQADKLPKTTAQYGNVAVPMVGPEWADLNTQAENIRREIPTKIDVIRENCRAISDRRGETTWLLFAFQLIVFFVGILLLFMALAVQSYNTDVAQH